VLQLYHYTSRLRDHFKNREHWGDTSVDRDRVVANGMIEPHLVGDKAFAKLTRRTLQDWIDKLVDAPPRARTAKNATQNHRQATPTDPEYLPTRLRIQDLGDPQSRESSSVPPWSR
jgi:hypothetical protein